MYNWECPHCNKHQTVTDDNCKENTVNTSIEKQIEGRIFTGILSIRCSNRECLKTTMSIAIRNYKIGEQKSVFSSDSFIFFERVIPSSKHKIQPEYIPKAIRDDYYEACSIVHLSPKASATLIRRCLQGMIRDFAQISRGTLNGEIIELKRQVSTGEADRAITSESVEAIDHIRSIGNIGAHMEKDINTIIEVDPNEANALIEVSEMLFDEWYGERHRRQERLKRVKSISENKSEQKKHISGPET